MNTDIWNLFIYDQMDYYYYYYLFMPKYKLEEWEKKETKTRETKNFKSNIIWIHCIEFTKNYSVNVLYLYKISIQISIKCIREHRILFMISRFNSISIF